MCIYIHIKKYNYACINGTMYKTKKYGRNTYLLEKTKRSNKYMANL